MQIRARSEAKRILRVFRLSCASVGIAVGKILAHSIWQRQRRCKEAGVKKCDQAERKMSHTSSALKNKMAAATTHATALVNRELANSPILERSPVNRISGITANGN